MRETKIGRRGDVSVVSGGSREMSGACQAGHDLAGAGEDIDGSQRLVGGTAVQTRS